MEDKKEPISSMSMEKIVSLVQCKIFVHPDNTDKGFSHDEMNLLIEKGYIPWVELQPPETHNFIYLQLSVLKNRETAKQNKEPSANYKTFVRPEEDHAFTEKELSILFELGHVPWPSPIAPHWPNYLIVGLSELIAISSRSKQ